MSAHTRWILLIAGLLLISVLTQIALVVTAIDDPSFAIEPDYERKAAEWDSHQRRRQESRALDWTVGFEVHAMGVDNDREVSVELYDQYGKPIRDAAVAVAAFHNARASDTRHVLLTHIDEARYTGSLPVARAGLWEFRIEIERGDQKYAEAVRKTLPEPSRRRAGGRP